MPSDERLQALEDACGVVRLDEGVVEFSVALEDKADERGERIALWFNAWTSTAVVIGGDGKVRKPLFSEDGAGAWVIDARRRDMIECGHENVG